MCRPTNGKSRPPGGDKDEDEGQPSPKNALEHLEASLDEECDDKDVHYDHDAKKCSSCAERRLRPEAMKINGGYGREKCRCSKSMERQSGLKGSHFHPHIHRHATQDPTHGKNCPAQCARGSIQQLSPSRSLPLGPKTPTTHKS